MYISIYYILNIYIFYIYIYIYTYIYQVNFFLFKFIFNLLNSSLKVNYNSV